MTHRGTMSSALRTTLVCRGLRSKRTPMETTAAGSTSGGKDGSSGLKTLKGSRAVMKPRRVVSRALYPWPSAAADANQSDGRLR